MSSTGFALLVGSGGGWGGGSNATLRPSLATTTGAALAPISGRILTITYRYTSRGQCCTSVLCTALYGNAPLWLLDDRPALEYRYDGEGLLGWVCCYDLSFEWLVSGVALD